MSIYLSRNLHYHLTATYVPSCLIVIIAWLGLFISPTQTEGNKVHWSFEFMIRHINEKNFIFYPHKFSKPNMTISARVGMNLTSLLTLIAMFDGVRSEVPKVSYISFMDIWMTVCVIIIFFAIVEYAVSHSLLRHKKKSTAILVDKVSRYAMMILFILFNAGYWPVLLDRCNFCKTDSHKGS